MLSCLHCFCRECLNIEVGRQSALKENSGEGPQQGREARPEQSKVERPHQGFNCPTCQKPVTIPVGGVRDLAQDLHLGIGVKVAQYQSKVASKDVVPCDVCIDNTSSGPAVGFCCSCHHFMCQLCCDHHKRARNFYQHDVIALGEAVPKERFSVTATCALHNKEFVFYCETCSCLICHDCTTTDHRDHIQSAKLPSIVATARRDDIRKLLTSAQEVLSKLTDGFKGNITIMKEVEDNEEAVSQSIKQTFVRIHQALDDRMNKVLKQIHDFALSKKTALMLQNETIESLKQDLSCCVDIASCFHQCYTDCEIIALNQLPSTELQASINKAQNLLQEPCECSSDIKVVFDNPMSNPDVCHLADFCPEQSAWNSTCLRATRGSKYVLTVYAKDSNGQEYLYDDIQLKVELKPPDFGAAVLGDVEQCSDGSYTISLVPVHKGPHLLNVTMNGKHVQLSPYKLQVEEPRTTKCPSLYQDYSASNRKFYHMPVRRETWPT